MATQLNIKNAETVRMARTLAQKLGGSVTAAVRQAIEEKLDATLRAEAKPSIEEAFAMLTGLRRHWKPEFDDQELSIRHGDLLYDEHGLPK
jgi:antitoxin VapB